MTTASLENATSNLLHDAVNFFHLGNPISMEAISEGLANRNFLVTTESGQFVIKDLLIHTPEEIELEMVYLERLIANNFPAPAYIQSVNGERIFLQSGHILVAQKKLDGKHPEATPDVCEVLGKWLAKLHKIPCEGLPPRKHWMTPDFLPAYIELLQNSHLTYKEQALASYKRLSALDFNCMPQAIIHNDVYRGNLLFDGLELRAMLDWEESAVSAAILDIASAIRYFCLNDTYLLIEENYNALLNGYLTERILKQVELDNLRDTVQFVALTNAIWLMTQFGIQTPDEEKVGWGEGYWRYNFDDLELPKI
jgi:homoserine kinase type II